MVGGGAMRIWLLACDGTGWMISTYSMFLDRLAGVIALAVIMICCLPWSFDLISEPTGRVALLAVGIGSIGTGFCFLALGFAP